MRYPSADDFADVMNAGTKGPPEEQGATICSDIVDFFSGKRPEELRVKDFKALRHRWGFKDGTIHTAKSIAIEYKIDLEEYFEVEVSLVSRLGWVVMLNKQSKKKWLDM